MHVEAGGGGGGAGVGGAAGGGAAVAVKVNSPERVWYKIASDKCTRFM